MKPSKTSLVLLINLTLAAACPPAALSNEEIDKKECLGYLEKSLPELKRKNSALSYHDIDIKQKNPLSAESLIPLSKYGVSGESYYARKDGLNAPYYSCICPENGTLRLRKTVLDKLRKINRRLASIDVELYVFDAYRPVSCQSKLWTYFMAEAKRVLKAGATEEELIQYAGKFCSNPGAYKASDWRTWPTHLTGGAVDLSLRRKSSGELLYMGGIFDDASDLSISDHFENRKAVDPISASDLEARRNRRLLYWAMKSEGFANYPNEWWHFDYGNQMWVQNGGASQDDKAFYGAI